MKRIYVFSGLGVDDRVFKNLDFSAYQTTFIKWIQPLQDETIEGYAQRLTAQISTENPILIGLSFGGMMAIEVAKLIQIPKIILIASAKSRKEIPFYYRLVGKLNLHKLAPVSVLKKPTYLSYWFFGTENAEDRKLLAEILNDTDPDFLKWAIDKIVNWENTFQPENLIHIHGKADRILPPSFVKANYLIKDGGHFMTVNKAAEMNKLINSLLEIN